MDKSVCSMKWEYQLSRPGTGLGVIVKSKGGLVVAAPLVSSCLTVTIIISVTALHYSDISVGVFTLEL
jgi:hypothetical protein